MVDENRTLMFTEHVHIDPRSGDMTVCKALQQRIRPIFNRGFERAEVFLKLLPDGSLDIESPALHMFWKGDPENYAES